jgi:hypothetical protein
LSKDPAPQTKACAAYRCTAKDITMNVVSHVNEDDLEQYAMHTLRASACATLEEHLLICSECRERMDAEMEFLAAMKSAAVSFRKQGKTAKHKAASC